MVRRWTLPGADHSGSAGDALGSGVQGGVHHVGRDGFDNRVGAVQVFHSLGHRQLEPGREDIARGVDPLAESAGHSRRGRSGPGRRHAR